MRSLVADRAPLLPVFLSLAVGIMAGFALKASITLLPFLIGSVVLALCLHRQARAQSVAILLSVALLGMLLANRQSQTARQRVYDEHSHELQAVVASECVEKPRSIGVDLLLSANGHKLKCYLQKNDRSRQLKPGDGLLLYTRVRPFVHRPSAGVAFDYPLYMQRQGYAGQCYASDKHWTHKKVSLKNLSVLERSRVRFLRIRHGLLEHYRLLGANDDGYAVLAAMTLGDKSALDRELRDVYSVTGASHVLALSGLHLGMLYMLLSFLTGSHRRRHLWAQVVLVLGIWAFAMLVGLPVSVVRSATMISLFAIFSLGYRQHLSFNVLCLAAIVILLQNPYALYDVGFQLSFASVASILLLLPLVASDKDDSLKPASEPSIPRRVASVIGSCLAVSLAAQVGVAPLIAYYFGRFSTYFLLTNLIVLPAAYLILCGTLLMLVLPVAAPLVLWVVDALNQVLTIMSRLPLSSINDLHPSVAQVVMWYVAVAALCGALLVWKGRWRWD